MNFKLVFPGEAPPKKNSFKRAYTKMNKQTGIYEPLKFPIEYYSKQYNEWAWTAVQYLRSWKEKQISNPITTDPYGWVADVKFPLEKEYVISMHFYRKTNYTGVDLQNLYDTILDTLAGHSGIEIPKKFKMEHEDYKILSDDSFEFLKSHGASYIFYDPMTPRTEVFISEFTLTKLVNMMKICHPEMEKIDWGVYTDKVAEELESFDLIKKEKRIKASDIKVDINLDELFNKE